jgi:hypothetical protein
MIFVCLKLCMSLLTCLLIFKQVWLVEVYIVFDERHVEIYSEGVLPIVKFLLRLWPFNWVGLRENCVRKLLMNFAILIGSFITTYLCLFFLLHKRFGNGKGNFNVFVLFSPYKYGITFFVNDRHLHVTKIGSLILLSYSSLFPQET